MDRSLARYGRLMGLGLCWLACVSAAEDENLRWASIAAWQAPHAQPVPLEGLKWWHRPGLTLSTNAYYGGPDYHIQGTTDVDCPRFTANVGLDVMSCGEWTRPFWITNTAPVEQGPFTFLFWAWANPLQPSCLVSMPPGTGAGFEVWHGDGRWGFGRRWTVGDGLSVDTDAGTATNAAWHHLAFVYDGLGNSASNMTVWLNARLPTVTTSFWGNPGTNWTPLDSRLQLFSWRAEGYRMADYVDELLWYDRALSSNEIAQIMNATRGGR